MELESFIGKIVISAETKKRYILYEITSPSIAARTAEPDANGYRACYSWSTINGDPISTGLLVFEDSSLNEKFKTAYKTYCHTKDAYYEEMDYWMRKG